MRTLKKTLCLVLALVLCFGLVGTAFAADYTKYSDADTVGAAYEEAVAVLMGLDIVNGMTDTEIGPTGTFTRAQAAKIIAYMELGATVAAKLPAGTTDFTDVPADHWASAYIGYCAKEGIIAGYGDGTFGPEDELTGYQWAAMILRAVGYGQNGEYTGTGWAIAVAKEAFKSGIELFKGDASAATDEPIERQQAMLMAFNGLYADLVVYDKNVESYVNDDNASDFAADVQKLGTPVIAVIAENDATGYTVPGKTVAYQATVDADGTISDFAASATAYTYATGADMVGKLVKIYTAGTKVVSILDVGTYVEVAKAITTADALKAAFGATLPAVASSVATFSDTAAYTEDTNFTTYDATDDAAVGTYTIYGKEVVGYSADLAADVVVVKVAVTDAEKGLYKVGTAADDDLYVVKAATAAASHDKVTSAAAIDWLGYVKAGADSADVLYVVSRFGNKYNFSEVKTVTGKVTKLGAKLSIDGVDYDMAADATAAAALTGAITSFTISSDSLDFTNTFKFYLDEAGKVFAAVKVTDEQTDSNNYALAYVLGVTQISAGADAYGVPAYSYNVQYYTLDGAVNYTACATLGGLKVADEAVNNKSVKYDSISAGWYLLASTDAGAALKTLNSETAVDGYKIADVQLESALSMTANTTKFGANLITSSSAFVYSTASAVASTNKAAAVVNGAHTSTIAAATYEVVTKANASNATLTDLVAVWVGADLAGTTDTAEVVYVVSYDGQVSAENVVTGAPATYSYTVVKADGTKESMVVTTAYAATGIVGNFKKLVKDAANGTVSFDTPANSFTTETISSPEKSACYTVDGVKYLTVSATDYVVTNAVVVDLRTNPTTVINTVDGMLGQTITATAVYKTDVLTSQNVVSLILITANAA